MAPDAKRFSGSAPCCTQVVGCHDARGTGLNVSPPTDAPRENTAASGCYCGCASATQVVSALCAALRLAACGIEHGRTASSKAMTSEWLCRAAQSKLVAARGPPHIECEELASAGTPSRSSRATFGTSCMTTKSEPIDRQAIDGTAAAPQEVHDHGDAPRPPPRQKERPHQPRSWQQAACSTGNCASKRKSCRITCVPQADKVEMAEQRGHQH